MKNRRLNRALLTGVVSTLSLVGTETASAARDRTPPAAITDVQATGSTHRAVMLAWTATGDDGTVGTATTYDLRYSINPIDEGNWGSASQVVGEPSPGPSGTPETFDVPGLFPSTGYYFAIKAIDEAGNASPLSNVATGTTAPAPFTPWVVAEMPGAHSTRRSSIAMDPAVLRPTVVFATTATGDQALKFARVGDFGWEIETILAGNVDSIQHAYDPLTNQPVVSFSREIVAFENEQLCFARFDGTSWNIEVIDSARFIDARSSLAFDPNGNPSIVYARNVEYRRNRFRDEVVRALWNGTAWDTEIVVIPALGMGMGSTPHLYQPDTGLPLVAYNDGNGNAESSARVASFNGSTWTIETVPFGGPQGGLQLALDPFTGEPIVTGYPVGSTRTAEFFRRLPGGTWSGEVYTDGNGFEPQLIVLDDGAAVIAHWDWSGSNNFPVLHFSRLDPLTGEWTEEEIDPAGYSRSASLILTPWGSFMASFRAGSAPFQVFVAERIE